METTPEPTWVTADRNSRYRVDRSGRRSVNSVTLGRKDSNWALPRVDPLTKRRQKTWAVTGAVPTTMLTPTVGQQLTGLVLELVPDQDPVGLQRFGPFQVDGV